MTNNTPHTDNQISFENGGQFGYPDVYGAFVINELTGTVMLSPEQVGGIVQAAAQAFYDARASLETPQGDKVSTDDNTPGFVVLGDGGDPAGDWLLTPEDLGTMVAGFVAVASRA